MIESKKKILFSILVVYLSAGFSFLYILILSHQLTVAVYAQIALAISYSVFSQILVNFSSDKYLLKILKESEDWKKVAFNNFIFRILLLFLITMLFATFANSEKQYLPVFLWYTLNALYPRSISEYLSRISRQNFVYFVEKLLSFCIIGVSLGMYKIYLPETFYLLCIVRLLFIVYEYYSYDVEAAMPELRLMIYGVGQSGVITLALLLNAFMLFGVQIFLSEMVSDTNFASVALALQFCMVVQLFQSQVVRFSNLYIFSTKIPDKNIVRIGFLKLLFGNCILVFIMLTLAYILNNLFFDDKYQKFLEILIMLSPWLVVLGVGSVQTQFILAKLGSRKYLLICITSFLISCMSFYPLVKEFGSEGFVVQLYVAHLSAMVLGFVFLKREFVRVWSIT